MKKILPIALLLLFLPAICNAAPQIAFSDLINGPKSGIGDSLGEGAIVTIWGHGFGVTQGTSKVYFKDSLGVSREAAYVYYWKAADGTAPGGPAKLNSHFDMYEIAFSIPSASADGAGKIYIEVGSETSNEVDFYARSTGRFWFVKSDGSDIAAGTYAAPRLTLQTLTASGGALSAGDILYVLGSYTHSGDDLDYRHVGSENNHIAVISYPNSLLFVDHAVDNDNVVSTYWVWSKVEVEYCCGAVESAAFGRFVGLDIHGDGNLDTSQSGAFDCHRSTINSAKLLGCEIHNIGPPSSNYPHATYFQVRNCTDGYGAPEVAYNYLHDNTDRFGIHYYDEGSTETICPGNLAGTYKVHHNVVENQYGPGINIGVSGNRVGGPVDFPIEIYNNLLINTGQSNAAYYTGNPVAMQFYGLMLGSHIKIYNNTIYGYGTTGVATTGAFGVAGSGENIIPGSYEFVNNIIVDTNDFSFIYTEFPCRNLKTPTAMRDNIWYSPSGNLPPAADTGPITTNPNLVGGSPFDYRLSASSTNAIGAGYDASALVTDDLRGMLRGVPLDIGAFEYAEGEAPAPATHRLRAKPLLP